MGLKIGVVGGTLLDLADHRCYQMLLGMLQWLITIGKPELCPAVACFNRFAASPRCQHLELTLQVFGHVKTVAHKVVGINSRHFQFTWTSLSY